jgi:ribosomal-protein-serine acetyltransferase
MFSQVVTPTISLRLLEERHSDSLFQLTERNRAYLRCHLPWLDFTRQADDTKNFIRNSLRGFIDSGCFVCGVWFENTLCGVIGYNRIDWPNKTAYLGYWLSEDFQGKGIITTCCRFLINHAFTEYSLNKIVIFCGADNTKSQAIPDRLGFVREGVLKEAEWLYDHFVDHTIHSLLKRNHENA